MHFQIGGDSGAGLNSAYCFVNDNDKKKMIIENHSLSDTSHITEG